MPTSMTRISRQTASDLRLLFYARLLLVFVAVLGAGVIVSFTGSLSAAKSEHSLFLQHVKDHERDGITLAEELARPLTVTRSGGQENISNPLKFDFLELGKSVRALQGTAMISTALDLVTFVVAPLLFLIIGSYLATVDLRSRTVLVRASREHFGWITAGRLTTVALLSAATPLVVAAWALLVGLVGNGPVDELARGITFPLVEPEPRSPMLLQLATTALISLFFGLAGYAIGVVTRSTSWPMVLSAVVLFAVPFLSVWDPRNLLATIGSQVYSFWGQFRLGPPLGDLDTGTALAALAAYLAASVLFVALSARSPRLP